MKRIALLLLCLAILIGAVGCGDAEPTPQDKPTVSVPDESATPQYVVDPLINRFILEFEQQKRYVLAGLSQNSDLSCTGYIDVCQLTMRTTPQGLHFSLTGGDDIKARDRMLDIFYSIAQVADPSCTDSQMNAALTYLEAQTETITNHRVSNYITVNAYVPIVRLETVKVDCRMDFTATNYRPEDK